MAPISAIGVRILTGGYAAITYINGTDPTSAHQSLNGEQEAPCRAISGATL